MTTAKVRHLLVLLLLASLLLGSCGTNTSNLSPLHLPGSGEGEETRTPAAEHDYVILPATASDALTARARAFCETLSARTGIPATLFFDDEAMPERENARLVLLGNTAHELSYKHLNGLRRDDYLCTTDEGTLILGGKSDAATVAAIDRFCETLLPYADATILVNADQHFLVRATYAVEAITLDGYSLGDYRLVYPKENGSREREIAQALREAIADRCGFYPEILADSAVSERSRIITVGACFGETFASETRFFATGSHVSLCGGSEHALAAVAQAFCDYLFPADAHGSLAVSIETSVAVKESAPTLSAYTALLHEDDPSVNLTEIVHLAESILAAEPLFVPSGTINPSALSHLQLSLPTYTAHSVLLNTDCALPFFYRGDAMTLLEERVTDGACVLRFSLANTAQTVTVYHATADTQAAADALVQAAAQALTENELCLLFLCTPTDVLLGASTVFDPIGTTDGGNESMHVLLYRPSDLISTTATPPDGADALYSFTLTHPFLRT